MGYSALRAADVMSLAASGWQQRFKGLQNKAPVFLLFHLKGKNKAGLPQGLEETIGKHAKGNVCLLWDLRQDFHCHSTPAKQRCMGWGPPVRQGFGGCQGVLPGSCQVRWEHTLPAGSGLGSELCTCCWCLVFINGLEKWGKQRSSKVCRWHEII